MDPMGCVFVDIVEWPSVNRISAQDTLDVRRWFKFDGRMIHLWNSISVPPSDRFSLLSRSATK